MHHLGNRNTLLTTYGISAELLVAIDDLVHHLEELLHIEELLYRASRPSSSFCPWKCLLVVSVM